jgi:tetratricopeptide (TPR) repeat protein
MQDAHEIQLDLSRREEEDPFDLANSYNNLGVLHQEAGRITEATMAYESAREILERLVASNSEVVEHQRVLSAVLHNLTRCQENTASYTETVQGYEKVLKIYEGLAKQNPGFIDLRNQMGRAYSNLGRFTSNAGQSMAAMGPLEKALSIFEDLSAQHSTVPHYKFELARVLSGLSYAQQFSGQAEQARQGHRRVIDILEPLYASHPEVMEYQGLLGDAYVAIGWHHQLQKAPDEAEAAYGKALALLEPVVVESHGSHYQRSLGQAYHELGMLYAADSPEQAAENYQQAIEVRMDLVAQRPSPMNLSNLAWSYVGLAAACDGLGESGQAIERNQKAVEVCQRMLDTWPDVPMYRSSLANRLTMLAIRYGRTGRREEAVATYEQAIVHSESLVEMSPDTDHYAMELATQHAQLGELLRRSGNSDSAVEHLGRAVDLLNARLAANVERPDAAELELRVCHALRSRAQILSGQMQQHDRARMDAELALERSPARDRWLFRLTCAEVQLRSGDIDSALAEVEDVLQATEQTAEIFAETARIYALAVGQSMASSPSVPDQTRESYAQRSSHLVQEAIALDRRRTLEALNTAAFDAVRQRADFQALLSADSRAAEDD